MTDSKKDITTDLIILGGGASGVFAALAAKECNAACRVLVIEKSSKVLSKVLRTGGGRCNLTNANFDPKDLSTHYPRGEKELIGPLSHFGPSELMEWFESKGVSLKVEAEGRVFPKSNLATSIVNCLTHGMKINGVELITDCSIESLSKENDLFHLSSHDHEFFSSYLLIATANSEEGYRFAKSMGHTLVAPHASLFALQVPSSPYLGLSGLSLERVSLSIKGFSHQQEGPLLFTHEGFSGPSVLKLSAHTATFLYEKNYQAELIIDWLPNLSLESVYAKISTMKSSLPSSSLLTSNPFAFPKPFWKKWLENNSQPSLFSALSLKELRGTAEKLKADHFKIEGKINHKEEFVTAGGVKLSEINFKRMESKCCKKLFFAGEILNIDGETGGYNLQNAWTTGFIAGSSVAEDLDL